MNEHELEQVNQRVSNWAEQTLDMLLVVLKPLTDVFRQAYNNVGMPYGDSEEGFTRWLSELEQSIPDYRR